MQHFELKGTTRKVGNKAVIKAFRREGLVPCNLYGLGMDNVLFTVNAKELKVLTDTPKSYIVDLVLDGGKPQTAILHELQWHPVTDACLHVDFLAVNETKPIAISVPLVIEGHAKGVQQGGKFYQNARSLKVSALMKDLPDELDVDITQPRPRQAHQGRRPQVTVSSRLRQGHHHLRRQDHAQCYCGCCGGVNPTPPCQRSYLVVGLGNIGAEYARTRHNIGFMMLDAWAQASNVVFPWSATAPLRRFRTREGTSPC